MPLPGQNFITTFAGTDYIFPGHGKPGPQAPLGEIYGLAVDARGYVYIPDTRNDMVLRLAPDGILEIFAGNGLEGFSGDGGPARNASLADPNGVAIDARGNVFITDSANYRVRRVSPEGIITTVAGDGRAAHTAGGPALQSSIGSPSSPVLDAAGNLYFFDIRNTRVRVLSGGQLRTIAGNGRTGFAPDGSNPADGPLSIIVGLAVDNSNRLLLAERDNHRVRMIDGGVYRTIAGTGIYGSPTNGPPANSALASPSGLVVDSQGNIYVGMEAYVVRISAGRLTILAGDGEYAYRGDGRPATSASLSAPTAVAVDTRGNVFISDEFCLCVRVVNTAGIINTAAGNPALWRTADNTPATRALLGAPFGLAFTSAGNLLVANRRLGIVGSISPAGLYSSLVGSVVGFGGDGGPAKNALMDAPTGIAIDPRTNRIYIADAGSDLIRAIDANGIISTYAGNPRDRHGFAGDNGPAALAKFSRPHGLAVDSSGNLYIADRRNHRVRIVTPDGMIRTYAGDGQDRYFGDGRPPQQASLREPVALAFVRGELLIADAADDRIRIVRSDGTMATFAGTGVESSTGDGGPATRATFAEPSGLAVDAAGNVFVLEAEGSRVRRIDTAGNVTTVAGTGVRSFSGDGGSSLRATFDYTQVGIALNRDGDLFIADTLNDRIRVIRSAAPNLTVNRQSVSISVPSGERSAIQTVTIQSNRAGVLYNITTGGGDWLRLATRHGTSALEVVAEISADASALAPGTHAGSLRIATEVTLPRQVTIPVEVTVTPPRPPKLDVQAPALTLESITGSAVEQDLAVNNTGGGTLNFQVEATTASGKPWLAVESPNTAPADSSVNIKVRASAEDFTAGTYSGSIRIAAGDDEAIVPVTFAVRDRPRPKLLISQSGLTFEAVARGGAPAPGSIGILNEGAGELSWTASARTLSGGDWLSIRQNSGRVDRPLFDVSLLDIEVRSEGLAAGDYYGRIEISAASDNSPQIATVLLHVLPEGSNPGPEVRPAGLIFTGARDANPGAQFVTIHNLLAGTTQYVSSRLGFGEETFTHSPTQSTVAPNAPARVVVQPEFRNLAPGVRQGLLTLFFDDGRSKSVNVLTVVAPPGTEATRSILGCPSDFLRIEFTSLRDGFVAVVGEPMTIEVRIVDDCGNFFTPLNTPNSSVQVGFTNQDPPIKLVHVGNGTWTGTWRPLRAVEGGVQIDIAVYYLAGNRVKGFGNQRTGSVRIGGRSPIVRQGSLRHSATFETHSPVAPGQLISVIGGNLADREDRVNGFPLPRELGETEVLLGGRALPLLYTSEGQINAQVPYDLPVHTQHQVLVRRGNTLSVPESFVVASAVPGIFTRNEQGFGQGAIFRAGEIRAEAGTPAAKGEEVTIFCTGLGAVSPAIEPGVAASDPPPQVIGEITVTIGGVPAEVKFAGLTPGVAGRYQVRVVVPEQAPSGDEVPVVISAGVRSSQQVTMAIR